MDTQNIYEAAARSKKRESLIAVIVLSAVGIGEDPFTAEFASKLHEAGEDFWAAAATSAGCNHPSAITQNEVVMFFAMGAAKKRLHEKDADCTVDAATDSCIGCGVDHSGVCDFCGGRGLHVDGCAGVA